MYYLFRDEYPPETSIPDTDEMTAEYINKGISLRYSKAIPFDGTYIEIKFYVNHFREKDVLPTTTATTIYSRRFLELLHKFEVNTSYMPVTIVDRKTGRQSIYYMISILDIEPILDMESTVIGIRRIQLVPYLKFHSRKAVFRDESKQFYVFTNDSFVREAKSIAISGCSFINIEEDGVKLV